MVDNLNNNERFEVIALDGLPENQRQCGTHLIRNSLCKMQEDELSKLLEDWPEIFDL